MPEVTRSRFQLPRFSQYLSLSLFLSDSLWLTLSHHPHLDPQSIHARPDAHPHTPTPIHAHIHNFHTLVKHSKSLPGQSERIQCSNQVDLFVHYGLSWTNQTKNFRSLLNIIEDLVEEYKTNFNRHQNFRKSFIWSIFFTYDSFESSHFGDLHWNLM